MTTAVASGSKFPCVASDGCSSLRRPFRAAHCWFCVSGVQYCGMLGDRALPDQQTSSVAVIQMTAELCLQSDGQRNLSFATRSLAWHLTTYWLSGSCESHRAFQSVFLGTTVQLHPEVLLSPLNTGWEIMSASGVFAWYESAVRLNVDNSPPAVFTAANEVEEIRGRKAKMQ